MIIFIRALSALLCHIYVSSWLMSNLSIPVLNMDDIWTTPCICFSSGGWNSNDISPWKAMQNVQICISSAQLSHKDNFLTCLADYDDMTEKKKQKNKWNEFYFVVEWRFLCLKMYGITLSFKLQSTIIDIPLPITVPNILVPSLVALLLSLHTIEGQAD